MTGGPVEVHHVVEAAPGLRADAPVVVLSNSLGSTLAMWDAQAPALAEHFRVVRYDTRGHGGSPVPPGPYSIDDLADDLLVLLDRLGVGRAHLVGLSLGGMTVLRLAARSPERVGRLAVLCTSALLGPAQGWLDRAATVRAQGTGAVADAVVARWYTEGYAAAHPDEVAAARAMVASVPAEGYAGCCEAIASMDLTADLADISAPTLAVAGAEDLATPPEHLERIASGVKDGSLLVLPQAAHVAALEQPEAVTRALLDHLSRR
ncbi:3-oxoadipate enol-lactonase [Knoellia sp. p5-6-4]|uniref:3-oxoadipate enol-lactonase n=1 Tax=unclassified Knoellia TaxID=2618719 RepID=UPI0023DC52B6|nr:3-oxoadipate enol-lactonase [Knoellia sp. p5-6-4]MDF2144461.1 3-oxoadipate enol-lactonase [Knoellia sp. p5-6-4]